MTGGLTREAVDLPLGRLSYLSGGDGPPVMLVHGNSSSGAIFVHQFEPLLASGRRVIAPDLPGHGASDDAREPAATYSFPGYAAALATLLDAIGVEAVDLVGWSLGGHVALELAATDPRVRCVLVTGTPPIAPSPQALQAAFRPSPVMALAGKEHWTADDAAAYASAMLDGAGNVGEQELADARRTHGLARRLMIENGLAGRGVDEAAFLRKTKIPVAIVQGTEDPFLDPAYLQALPQPKLWRGGVRWLQNLGHAPHRAAPDVFNREMLAFLDDADQAAARSGSPST